MVKIRKWIVHKNFDPSANFDQGWDYALLDLKKKIEYNNHIQPICLPRLPDKHYTGQLAFVYGWGTTKIYLNHNSSGCKDEWMYTELSVTLKEAMLRIPSQKNCQENFRQEMCDTNITTCRLCNKKTIICASAVNMFNETVVENVCIGDSGGKTSNVYTLVNFD